MHRRTRREFLAVGGAAAVGGCTQVSEQSQDARTRIDGRWPMQGYDARNTASRADASGPGTAKRVLWSYDTGDVVHSSPAVADNRVFLATEQPALVAFDAASGRVRWREFLPETLFGNAGPVVIDDRVVVGMLRGELRGYNFDGEQQWKTSITDQEDRVEVFSTPVLYEDRIYVTAVHTGDDYDGHLYSIDPATGTLSHRFRMPDATYPRPAIANGSVYYAHPEGVLRVQDLESGALQWKHASGNVNGESAPVVANGRVFASLGTDVFGFDAETGAVRWQTTVGENAKPTSPAYADGTVYVGGPDDAVHALDTATGETKWRFHGNDGYFAKPVAADGFVYAGSSGRRMYGLDAETGEKQWSLKTERRDDGWLYGAIHTSPAVVDDVLYFGSEDQKVYALASENLG